MPCIIFSVLGLGAAMQVIPIAVSYLKIQRKSTAAHRGVSLYSSISSDVLQSTVLVFIGISYSI